MKASEIIIEAISITSHEANRRHCQAIGDDSQPAWDDAPDWQKSSARMGVSKILSGEITKPEQSHESWMAQKVDDGWVYGKVKDPEAKTHPCMVDYDKLPKDQQKKDAIFFDTVRNARYVLGVSGE